MIRRFVRLVPAITVGPVPPARSYSLPSGLKFQVCGNFGQRRTYKHMHTLADGDVILVGLHKRTSLCGLRGCQLRNIWGTKPRDSLDRTPPTFRP